ncbi:hypothetical protein NLX67_19545 [Domibacillus sp. A3M-37]|uniref:hypothetical protein n=1 Tax=Domibacillus sp. A3M-37 TaxID=2962037 RepID=UPI0020B7ABC7|nr:hypothetical protein [Domibacillus sp. A3M-37]MCP3764541.1 hypothetical protein [Domibacillus sp. A3M-37]
MGTNTAGYYMFIENAYKRKRTPLLNDKTIEIMMNEIEMYKQSGKIICLVPTKDMYEQLMEHKSEKRSFLLFMSSHLGEFCLIPMGKDFAVDIITLPNGENERIEQFQSVLGGKVKKSSEVADSNKSLFASYVHEKDGKEAYVVDHLLMNWNVILMLRKIYTPQKFNQDGKRVKVICWLPAEKSIEKILKGYHHVDLVMVGKEELERWKSVPEEKIKDAINL